MFVKIDCHKKNGVPVRSVKKFVNYLEKENRKLEQPERESSFFNQYRELVPPEEVIREIDANTSSLKRCEARYFALMVSPSKSELEHIRNDRKQFMDFSRQVIREYAKVFDREYNGKKIDEHNIKYYAKIESTRSFKSRDSEVKENAVYYQKLCKLEKLLKIFPENQRVEKYRQHREELMASIPNKTGGVPIFKGMNKPGPQTHVHFIISRKDMSNKHCLSPQSPCKEGKAFLHGKFYKTGFHRTQFFLSVEKAFDRMFSYQRNYAESYEGRRTFLISPAAYFERIQQLSKPERIRAFDILSHQQLGKEAFSGSQAAAVLRRINRIIERSSSIGY